MGLMRACQHHAGLNVLGLVDSVYGRASFHSLSFNKYNPAFDSENSLKVLLILRGLEGPGMSKGDTDQRLGKCFQCKWCL